MIHMDHKIGICGGEDKDGGWGFAVFQWRFLPLAEARDLFFPPRMGDAVASSGSSNRNGQGKVRKPL